MEAPENEYFTVQPLAAPITDATIATNANLLNFIYTEVFNFPIQCSLAHKELLGGLSTFATRMTQSPDNGLTLHILLGEWARRLVENLFAYGLLRLGCVAV